MRGGFAITLVAALVAAGCVTTPSADVDANAAELADLVDAEGFAPIAFADMEFQELDLAVEEGLRLHADVYLPAGPESADAPAKFPTILLLSPYWGLGTRGSPELGYMPYDFLVQRLLPRGYAVVYGDLAGNGGSSGCWDFMGPVERKSAVAMVEAIAAQEWSDGKIGMMGLSYDGMTQIMAASDVAEHLVTVVPAAPLTHAYAGLRMNGVHYGGGWHSVLASYESSSLTPPVNPFGGDVNDQRAPGWLETIAASPQCLADNHAGDATGEYNGYYQARDYRALGTDVKASVFYMQGFLDANVKPDNYGEWFDAVPTTKKAWLGHWYHEYPIAENGGRDDMYLTLHRWFDFTLKGIPNGIDGEPAIDVQDSLGQWRHEAAWPPPDAAPLALYLTPDGLADAPGSGGEMHAFGGPAALLSIAEGEARADQTFALEATKDIHIAGRPAVNLTLASDRPTGVVVARLWDATDKRLISQGAFDLRYRDGLESARPLTPGETIMIGFELYPTDFLVRAGHEIALQLLTEDPFLWFDPDATLATLSLEVGGEGSFVTLPIVERAPDAVFLTSCGEHLEDVGCFLDLEDIGVEADD